MFDHLVAQRMCSKLSAQEQVRRCNEIMDERQIEYAVRYRTGSGGVVRLQEQ